MRCLNWQFDDMIIDKMYINNFLLCSCPGPNGSNPTTMLGMWGSGFSRSRALRPGGHRHLVCVYMKFFHSRLPHKKVCCQLNQPAKQSKPNRANRARPKPKPKQVTWPDVMWCGVVWYGCWNGAVWCGVVWYGMAWYSMVLLLMSLISVGPKRRPFAAQWSRVLWSTERIKKLGLQTFLQVSQV